MARWQNPSPAAGAKGLKAARAIGMLTYRNYGIMVQQQTDRRCRKIGSLQSFGLHINYQGDKLVQRFNAYSYWLLTKSMDSHHLARGRGGQLNTRFTKHSAAYPYCWHQQRYSLPVGRTTIFSEPPSQCPVDRH